MFWMAGAWYMKFAIVGTRRKNEETTLPQPLSETSFSLCQFSPMNSNLHTGACGIILFFFKSATSAANWGRWERQRWKEQKPPIAVFPQLVWRNVLKWGNGFWPMNLLARIGVGIVGNYLGEAPQEIIFFEAFFFFVGSDTLVRRPHFLKFRGNKTFGRCFFGKCWKHCANRILHAPGCVFFWFCIKKNLSWKNHKNVGAVNIVCVYICLCIWHKI